MSDPNIAEKYYGKLKAAGYETEADFVFNQGIQIKQLIAKLGLISIAADEGNMAKVKELIPPSCADVVREMRAEAVRLFVDNLIGAFESGFIDSNTVSLAQLHRVMQTHVEDNYQIKVPHIREAWGEWVADNCGFDFATNQLRNQEQEK